MLPASDLLVGCESVFEKVKCATGFQDSSDLGEGERRVGMVHKRVRRQRAVEGVVVEGEMLAVEPGGVRSGWRRGHAVVGRVSTQIQQFDGVDPGHRVGVDDVVTTTENRVRRPARVTPSHARSREGRDRADAAGPG